MHFRMSLSSSTQTHTHTKASGIFFTLNCIECNINGRQLTLILRLLLIFFRFFTYNVLLSFPTKD